MSCVPYPASDRPRAGEAREGILRAVDSHWVDTLDSAQDEQLRALLIAARAEDGWPSITSDGPLPAEFAQGPHLLASSGPDLIGYAHLDQRGDAFGRQVVELIVHPGHRGHGYGTTMADAALQRAQGTVRAWSHGSHPAAAALGARKGFTPVRELLRMAADLVPREQPRLPDGVRMRTFVGADEQAVVDVNARAFSWHPEQGAMTVDDLRAAEHEDWFDPDGFFLAEAGPSPGRVVGFHWTKVHPAGSVSAEPVGEVYVVGVDPDAHGGGTGKALTVAGLEHLRKRGLGTVILYVEGDNAPAIALYERLGFRTESVATQYERVNE